MVKHKYDVNLDEFPYVEAADRPRPVVFVSLSPITVDALKMRGYQAILLRTMPRRSREEDLAWIGRLLQGVTEGTVKLTKDQLDGLFYELKVQKLFSDRREAPNLREAKRDDTSIEELLDWDRSRHALGDTTAQTPEKVAEFVKKVYEFKKTGSEK